MTQGGTSLEVQRGPGLLVRAVWFLFVGWWLTGIMSAIGWFFMITTAGGSLDLAGGRFIGLATLRSPR